MKFYSKKYSDELDKIIYLIRNGIAIHEVTSPKKGFMRLFLRCFFATLFTISVSSAQNYDFTTLPDTFHLDPSKYSYLGEIKLGQGRVGPVNGAYWDVDIPINRPTWALALAHNYQLLHNYLRFEHFPMEAWLGIALKESSLGCDPAAVWDPALDLAPVPIGYTNDGFFQLRPDPSSGWGEMSNTYMPQRFTFSNFDAMVGTSHFETAALAATYYMIVTYFYWNFVDGYRPLAVFDSTPDPDAFAKIMSSQYYMGYDDGYGVVKYVLQTVRSQAETRSDFLTFYDENNFDTNAVVQEMKTHAEGVTRTVATLQNRLNTIPNSDSCAFHGYYDTLIAWSDVDAYLTMLSGYYPQINDAFRAQIKAVFDAQGGSNPVSFRYKMGPVIDAIVLGLPLDNPYHNISTYIGGITWDPATDYVPNFVMNNTAVKTPASFHSSTRAGLRQLGRAVSFTTNVSGQYSFQEIDASGKVLENRRIDFSSGTTLFDISKSISGVRFVRITGHGIIETAKIFSF